MEKEYYLGLDMGTSSVGWAVTDKEYRLLRAKGKDMWGIREFEEAQTAVERRTHRLSKRRRARQLVRIGLLKDYFHDEIMKIDPNFYIRLENSKYYLEDKDVRLASSNGIFDDKNYTDKDYYEQYKTIFHLRSELIHNSQKHDVRLVYLALLNMFKHRGHFLFEGDAYVQGNIGDIYKEFIQLLKNEYYEDENVKLTDQIDYFKLKEILSNSEFSRTAKAEKINSLVHIDKKNKLENTYIRLLCGLEIELKILFPEIDEKIKICFAKGYDEKLVEITEILTDNQLQILENLKKIHDIAALDKIRKGKEYLSDARVAEYEKHREDLALLKKIYREYMTKQDYDRMFREGEDGSYSAYVNSYNTSKKQRRNMKHRKIDEFYGTIRKDLKLLLKQGIQDDNIERILEEIDGNNDNKFMPKQLSFANGVIPNSLHKAEMKAILRNAETYLPFLLETDESGLTVSERILQLFSFHIPYYIGPVSVNSEKNNGNGWVVRREDGEVLPWNIEQKIDYGETSKRFIEKMVRRCTYISGEQVLPKNSFIYEKYCVLNEINNIKIDGERITVELKQNIYNDLYLHGKRVTKKQLINYLNNRGMIEDENQVSGIDINLNNYLGSYGKFLPIFEEKLKEDNYIKIAEDIIYLASIYGDSKKMLKSQIKSKYGDILDDKQIKRILGLKFKDWGRISRRFLELEGLDKETGEITTIIKAMWDYNLNFMEIIHSDAFDFKDKIEELHANSIKPLAEIEVEDLDDMYFSAPVKRMIWQTFKVIKEIEKVMGCPPKKVFIEMTRINDKKSKGKRTNSRKEKFLSLYKNIHDELVDWKQLIISSDESGKLNSKKMYLYLTQQGICMYTGRRINLEELFDDNKYDIDHIYPRHFVKDDNLENNLVLVEKQSNSRKSDTYPIDKSIRNNSQVYKHWKSLREGNFISKEKYDRLTGKNEFTDEQKAGFIARQMVETSQGTKGVADIIKQAFPQSRIIYSKASNVSEFRRKYDILKSRTVNEFHHAHDAYLNIVVGNVYDTKFTSNPLNFIKKQYNVDRKANNYNLDKMFVYDVKRGNEIAWIGWNPKKSEDSSEMSKRGTIVTVKKMLSKNTPLMTRMSFVGHGGIAEDNLSSHFVAKNKGYMPNGKESDVTKYGGYKKAKTAYFFVVEHGQTNNRIRTIETLPIYRRREVEKYEDGLIKYCEQSLSLLNPIIIYKKIKIQSLMKINGYYAYISGKSNEVYTFRNGVNMCLSQEWINYVKKLENYIEKDRQDRMITYEKNIELYEIILRKYSTTILNKRLSKMDKKLINAKDRFCILNVKEQSQVLINVFVLSRIGDNQTDLSKIGIGKQSGQITQNKKITGCKEFKLVNQSVTGLYENEIDLLTV